MLVRDLWELLESAAPAALAEPGDNCGLLVGDEVAPVRRVIAALELTQSVLDEAVAGSFDTVLTHHPLLFSPVRTLVSSRWRERLLRTLVAEHMTLFACHTNLDSAPGGLADIAGRALGLRGMVPLQPAPAGWCRLVGFVPADALEAVAAAVFATGAGHLGRYSGCAFDVVGRGWFTAEPGSRPALGSVGRAERMPEVRWETVVPRAHVANAVQAFIGAHPYEEPAFDVYPVDDVISGAGLGRVGVLSEPLSVAALAERVVEVFGLSGALWSGEGTRLVQRVGVVPGSGRSLTETAAGSCDVLVTGDVGYHAADLAEERGLSIIDVSHGEFEKWAFNRWAGEFGGRLAGTGVTLVLSNAWRCPWQRTDAHSPESSKGATVAGEVAREATDAPADGFVRIWIDGGSRGNPGPSAIGVVVRDESGSVIEAIGEAIGVATNNVAEYRALLSGLAEAKRLRAQVVEVASDSELLVKQMRGEYRVKNEALKALHAEARDMAAGFCGFAIRHIPREENVQADTLVNRALDEQEKAGL